MSQTLNLSNFGSLNIKAQTQFSNNTAVAVNSLPVNNSANFSSGGFVLIGELGGSTSEMLQSTAPPNGTTIPLSSSTALAHNFGDDVTLLFGNQINIYRANDVYGTGVQPPDSNFSKIATVSITANNAFTAYTDAAGTTGQWYKYTYYNSSSTAETLLSDSKAAQAGQVHYVSLDQVRAAAGFTGNANVTDDVISEKREAAEREINGALTALYSFPLPQPTNPIIVNLAKELAGGMLMEEEYTGINTQMANAGADKADKARNGGGKITSLEELRSRSVVLEDANYSELVTETGQGVSGWPDETTQTTSSLQPGYDRGFQATIDEIF